MSPLFLILAALAILGAASAMALRSAVHAILALSVAFVGLALLYLNLSAQFVGFTQIIVYVGAVAILAVFAVMMTRSDSAHLHLPVFSRTWLTGLSLAAGVFGILAWAILGDRTVPQATTQTAPSATVSDIGVSLIQRYALPLELIGLLLTAALIGAVILAMSNSFEATNAAEKGSAE